MKQTILLLILLMLSVMAHADETVDTNAPIVIARLDTPKVVLGEPIFLTLTFINRGTTVIPWANPQFMHNNSNLEIEFIPKEVRQAITTKVGIGYASQGNGNDPWRLQLGESRSMQVDLSLFYGIKKLGNYRFQVRYHSYKGSFQIQEEIQRLGLENMWEGTVTSNVKELTILEPKGADAEIFGLLKLEKSFEYIARPAEFFGSDNAVKVLSAGQSH